MRFSRRHEIARAAQRARVWQNCCAFPLAAFTLVFGNFTAYDCARTGHWLLCALVTLINLGNLRLSLRIYTWAWAVVYAWLHMDDAISERIETAA